jgi:hypothetical protein
VQLEVGFTSDHETNGGQSLHTRTWPQVELHAGVTSRIDVSVVWDGLVSSRLTSGAGLDESSTGKTDLRVGGKFNLTRRPRLNLAFVGYLNVPVGSAGLSSRYADPAARLAWASSVSDRFGVSGTADLKRVRDEDDRVRAKPAASVTLSSTIYRALDAFIGVAAEPPPLGSRPTQASVETGLVLPIGARTQVDVWVSRRLVGSPEDWFIGTGYVYRIR